MAARASSCPRKKSAQEERRRELSEKAMAFYAQHNVTGTVEKLLNQLFLAAPKDVYGYMADYLGDLAIPPVLSEGICRGGIDDRGGRAIHVSIHCTVHGKNKCIASASVPVSSQPPPPPPAPMSSTSPSNKKKKGVSNTPDPGVRSEPSEVSKKEEEDAVFAYDSFNTYIAPALVSNSPLRQQEIDSIISCLTDKEGKELHSSALLVTSLAVAEAAARLSSCPLYDHLISIFSPPPSPSSLSLPIPITSILAGGCGKLRIREFCILPLPGRTLPEQVLLLGSVYRSMGTLLTAKNGTPVVGPNGAYIPQLDHLESGLDLVRDAVTQAGVCLGQDVSVIIDVGADRLFDEQKQKYELVSGQMKTSEELMSMLTELLDSQPGVMGFIDPIRHKDIEGWKRLHETLVNRCLLVASEKVLEQSMESEEGAEEVENRGTSSTHFSCASLLMDRTISATFSKHLALSERARYMMLNSPPTLTSSSIHLIDIAVATKCDLVRLNAPCGVTSSGLLSRLLEIEEELSSKGIYKPAKALVFSSSRPLSQVDQQ